MATIHKEIEIERSKEFVWDKIRDVGVVLITGASQ
jgi:hypothetical protein